MLNIIRDILILVGLVILIILFFWLRNVFDQLEYCDRMLQTYAPICTRSAIYDFQTEDISNYSNIGGGMSVAYSKLVNDLEADTELNNVGRDLRQYFNLGVTAMNYSIPFIDPDKLQYSATEYLNKQLIIRSTEDYRCRIVSANIGVTDCKYEIRNIADSGIWGSNSSFYSNTNSTTALYNYNKYVQYFVKVKATAVVEYELPLLHNSISIAPHTITYDFMIPYELVN